MVIFATEAQPATTGSVLVLPGSGPSPRVQADGKRVRETSQKRPRELTGESDRKSSYHSHGPNLALDAWT